MEKKIVANPNEEIIKKLNEEHEDLFGKMTRLANTISDPAKVAKIGPVQVSLLEGQLKAMQAYDDILDRASRRAGWVMGNTSLTVKDSNADVKPTITYGVYGGGEGMNYVTHIGGYTRYDTVAAVHGNAVVNITGGTIGGGHSYGKNPDHGSYAGGRVASIHGYADMLVSGSANVAAVYGGNDVSGMIIGYGRNTTNQSGGTLTQDDTRTYVCITGTPTVGHVFGGGNGQYPYYRRLAGPGVWRRQQRRGAERTGVLPWYRLGRHHLRGWQ